MLPGWAIARRARSAPRPEGRPFALVRTVGGAVRITDACPLAQARGVRAGAMLAQARMLAQDLAVEAADPAGDAAALTALARWCGRWSPFAAAVMEPLPHLMIDATGSENLFGGDDAMVRDVAARLAALGLTTGVAMADTVGAAYALALSPQAPCAAPRGGARRLVSLLPVEALRITPDTAEALRGLGLATIGDVARQPGAGLARRFGPGLLRALARAQGLEDEPLDPLEPPRRRAVRLRLAEPLLSPEGLAQALSRAAQEVCRLLAADGEGARRLTVRFYRVDGATFDVSAGASRPLADPAAWTRLLATALEAQGEALDLGFGVDCVAGLAEETARLDASQPALDPDVAAAVRADQEAQALADRLAARLGPDAVVRLAPVASHIPERAQTLLAPGAPAPKDSFDPVIAQRRPPFLLARPEPLEALAEVPDGAPRAFRWRRRLHRVARAEGPERIASEWWREAGPTRDYFKVETEEGRRFWLYRSGLFGRETDAPRWYLHGSWG